MSSCAAGHRDHHHAPSVTPAPGHAECAAAIILALTIVTMAAEIVAGWWTGSMALLADGWHVGMHAAAMAVAVFAYRFARRHAGAGRYSAGAHKAPDLGAFANAVMLAVIAVALIHVLSDALTSALAIVALYNRFNRWSRRGVWLKLLDALVDADMVAKSSAIDSTYIKPSVFAVFIVEPACPKPLEGPLTAP